MENGKLAALLSLIVGITVGSNWPKIRKYIPKVRSRIQETFESICEKTAKKVGDVVGDSKKASKEVAEMVIKPKTGKEQILTVLEDSPQGKTLVELGKILEVHFVKLASPIKELVETGKVIKKDKAYLLS